MRIGVLSIFPEMFESILFSGIVGRAYANNQFGLTVVNPRDFTQDNYRRIDDKTFGGGAGMVMKIAPLEQALAHLKSLLSIKSKAQPKVIYLSPQGKTLNQSLVNSLAKDQSIILVCGRYEGVDERFIERNVDFELSVGDFVVSGGELPAMLVIDTIVRQLDNVVNSQASIANDSFMHGLLDCPHYTAPRDYQSHKVPAVLLSGNHQQIEEWRLQQSLWRTYLRRPDLLASKQLSKKQSRLLEEMISRNKIKKE